MKLGAHVSIGGKLSNALDTAKSIGCETIQIFTSNPRGWNFKIRTEDEIKEFCKKQNDFNISPVYGHMIYLVNLASDNQYIYMNSINALISGLTLANEACFKGIITHIGSHGGKGENEGIKRVIEALKQALKSTNSKIPIILETDAGPGNHLGYNFQQIAKIINGVDSKQIKVCIDTCHIFAAGYDIKTPNGFERVLTEFDKIVGLDRLLVIHLNDSKGDLGSKLDRHEIIGKGKIGLEIFEYIVNHPKLKHIDGIIETPDIKGFYDEKMSLDTLKELRHD